MADDDKGVLSAYRAAFSSEDEAANDLSTLAASLFSDGEEECAAGAKSANFDVTYVEQGEDAVTAVEHALTSGMPFQVIFLDMRMPPGIDGKETARRIRVADPDVHIVVVTGYSDSSPVEVAKVAGPFHRLYYLAKPFEIEEILQLARALSEKWKTERALQAAHAQLAEKVALLEKSNNELAASEARVRHAAFHDALTGAPNRAAFFRDLSIRIHAKQGSFAVAILDLDRFKAVNDNLGHAAGDDLIRSIWRGINDLLPAGSLAARMGGDEFGIILPMSEPAAALGVCDAIVDACSQARQIFGHSVQVGASIGLVICQGSESGDAIDLVRRADLALYAAKNAGRGRARLFDESLDESARFRLLIENGLRAAIANNDLSLVFQPIVEQETLATVGFEALVRWESDAHGAVPPSLFVPIAEEGALIHELSDWVVAHALEACKAWQEHYVSINFSPRQFHRPELTARLQQAVAAAGLTPDRVQVEITETALFEDVERAAAVITEIRGLGFRVALDDFGTGYSSLFNLKNFDISCIKVDRSFVVALGKEANSTAIVASITQLARSIGLGVVAEGVEDQFQHQALRLAGCSHMQGFLFGHPTNEAGALEKLNQDSEMTEPAARQAR
ncbi:MAG: EAL domain-containing protein [Terricaulis sp.]